MAATAASLLGEQLNAFFLSQFAPPPGTRHRLGFLGTGIAVDPDSFLSGGQFNPARVNSWVDVILDPLGNLAENGSFVEGSPWTASVVMQTIASQAKCPAPADSDEQKGFARAKSQAMENLGGSTAVSTAPLDWYDGTKVASWPHCSLETTSSSTSTTATATPGQVQNPDALLPNKRLWAWRTLAPVPVATTAHIQQVATPAPHITALGLQSSFAVDHTIALAARPVALASSATSSQHPSINRLISPVRAATFTNDVKFPTERIPIDIITQETTSKTATAQATVVSQAIATAANQASTSSVDTGSLSLKLNYLVVSLSRAPWWNDLMIALDNWFIPGLHRAALTESADAGKMTGVPIALILTSDVAIRAKWSAADRSAAIGNTHFGPWVLNSMQFKSIENSADTVLTIPGMQAIACIYRELPVLPPCSDPGLPSNQ